MIDFGITHGKWHVKKSEFTTEVFCDDLPICLLSNRFQVKQNATLISISPEILKILKELLDDLEDEVLSTSINDTINRAKKIINKVK